MEFCFLGINKYGYRFAVEALTRGIYGECLSGIPLTISHDASRLVGWSWPLAVHIAPGLARSVSITGIATDESDWEEINNRYHHHLFKINIEAQH